MIVITKAGKWQDMPSQPQFSVSTGDSIPIGNTTQITNGAPTVLSKSIADLMVSSGNGKFNVETKPEEVVVETKPAMHKKETKPHKRKSKK